MGLHWSDLDLTKGLLTISRGRVLVDGSHTIEGTPKTQRGARVLPLPVDVLTALVEMRAAQMADFGVTHGDDRYLAVDEAGQPMRPDRWSALWLRDCHAAGVPAVTLHAARHSSVTAMREAGVLDHIVAAWHGEYIMRKAHSHAQADGLAAAGQMLDELLTGPANGASVTLS